MAETFQNFCKMQDPTQPAFYLGKNHWSQYNILINLKTSNYSIFICANYRVGDRDSLLSTPKDCLHLSNKKHRSTELGMCWLWFLYFLPNWAEPMFLSPLPTLTTALFPSFFSRQSQGSSACGVWQARPCLSWAPSSEETLFLTVSIPAGGRQGKEEIEFIGSVAGIADNQVQN